ncbi:MAG: transposase [Pseudonocardiales bacterium]|nr:transposase [Pseudonocardiales bacterium]
MDGNGSAATAMLGLAGFVLLAVSELDGEVEQAIETTEGVVGCPGCGVLARLHDRRPVRVRDLPAAGRAVTLIWVKRVWRCLEPGCAVATWTERSEAIRPRASLTERARREACRRVGQDGHTVAQVAGQLGVGWATVMAAVVEYGLPLVDDPARLGGVSVLGVDETAFGGAGPRRSASFVTGLVDLSGPTARLLDVVPGRSGTALAGWVNQRPPRWRDAITVAALDPFRGYATALSTSLPAATRVLDCFHVTRLGFAAVDDVRRRVQQETTGHRGRRDDPLFRIRRLLRRRADRLTPTAWSRLLAGLDAGDREAQIGSAWIAAQDLRLIYQARGRADAEQRLHRWLTFCADTEIPELHRLARTIDSWRPELLAYFDTGGASNGPTEATNLLIKKVKRSGHGFRNLNNYRLRLLLHCGVEWHTQYPAPLRGRLPRSAA